MTLKNAITGIMILCIILTQSCAVVTNYGKKPEQDTQNKDTYFFSVYANSFAKVKHITQYAIKQIEAFKVEHGYVSYQILERYMPKRLVQPIIFKVKFSRSQ